ncbi:MAG TPA: phosphoglycolate phosphatase [Methanospirillum sp.]|uniref:phosphoglycolate phosphatase n=1 Tax=Methanospirillum sp. TaxID=45200 RepID=UPI002D13BBD3|nr:phosphoglycolate phosphatase [Methanospirillum sp.]HWQ64512.1 phosphoglycolate phosphatase [Methanospirillum sp.]
MLRAVITDIDGTLTDEKRRLSTCAIETIRRLQDNGVQVVLASGNTSCILKGLSKLIGTSGTFIGENGGVYRVGFTGDLKVLPNRQVALDALDLLNRHFQKQGITLDMYSPYERLADVAFARNVPVDEVRALLADWNVTVLDTHFAIHIQEKGFSKGLALKQIAGDLGISVSEFLAIGDSENDTDMIQAAGTGCCVANAVQEVKLAADYVSSISYGEGFVEVMNRFFPHILER